MKLIMMITAVPATGALTGLLFGKKFVNFLIPTIIAVELLILLGV